ncbi:MAG TPA: hypothetical protein V6D03_00790 [Candidatus Caenarcaniphilales bacterium]
MYIVDSYASADTTGLWQPTYWQTCTEPKLDGVERNQLAGLQQVWHSLNIPQLQSP